MLVPDKSDCFNIGGLESRLPLRQSVCMTNALRNAAKSDVAPAREALGSSGTGDKRSGAPVATPPFRKVG